MLEGHLMESRAYGQKLAVAPSAHPALYSKLNPSASSRSVPK